VTNCLRASLRPYRNLVWSYPLASGHQPSLAQRCRVSRARASLLIKPAFV